MDWLGVIYPKRCLGCREEGSYVCGRCLETIEIRGDGLRYEGVIRRLIKEIKYRACRDMTRELLEIWRQKVGMEQPRGEWTITSIPMWEEKRRIRGFNQAEVIARELAKDWGFPYREVLERGRQTRPMYGLNKEQRRENVKNVFLPKQGFKRYVNGKGIILVDDVWTTGATIAEGTRLLKQMGAKEVVQVAIAR